MILAVSVLIVFVALYITMVTGKVKAPWARSFGIWALALTALKCVLVWTAYYLDLNYDPMGTTLKNFSVPFLVPEILFIPLLFNVRQMTDLSWSLAVMGLTPFGAGIISGVVALTRYYSRGIK